MLETSARLLRLLSLLQTPREWTGPELADRLTVSTRTIRNDVERLRSLGYPVHATRGNVGGYRLGAGANLPPLLLDDDEAVAVTVGLRAAATAGIAGIEDTALRALEKLEKVMPHRLRRRVSALAQYTVAVPPDTPAAGVAPQTLSRLAHACRDHERVTMDYTAHDGTTTVRTVEPHRLVTWGRRWYLVAYDTDRGDWRTFRADRITPRPGGGERFAPREFPGGDVAAHVSGGVSAASWRYRTRVVIHAPAETVAARLTPAVGVVEPLDENTCALETGADSVETLALHLGLLDADFRVSGPPELVTHLRRLAARYHSATEG